MNAPLIGPEELVQLPRFVTVNCAGNVLTIRSSHHQITLNGPEPALRAIASARSPIRISNVAQKFSIRTDALQVCFDQLRQEGMLLRLSAEATAKDVDAYLGVMHDNFEVRANEVINCPFWQTVIEGNASQELIVGWGVEFFHFINSSNEYMPLAVAQTPLPTQLRLLMAQHCVEESDHGRIILSGLAEIGIPERSIRESVPLPTTTALVNFLTELANANSLAYLSTFGVMQQRRERPPAIEYERFRDHLVASYPTQEALFKAIHKHTMIDDELDHNTLVFDDVVRAIGLPSCNEREAITSVVRRFAWSFSEFFSGILRWYGRGVVMAPRRTLTVDQFR